MTAIRFLRRKSIENMLTDNSDDGLKRTLSANDLVLIGVGSIIGAGIFVLTGQAAAIHAGPAIILSFLLAGLACAIAAYCYSELASMIPLAGSAYTYSYVAFGEIVAWLMGWALVLEFSLGGAVVAMGWSGYLASFIESSFGLTLPVFWTSAFSVTEGGGINLPAALVILALTWVLYRGMTMSKILNTIIVIVKVAVILLFVLAAAGFVRPENYSPFMPFGFNGVISGAAMVFFSYIGFDIVATLSQETRNPQKDVPIGILGALGICTALYLAVAVVLVGVISYSELNVPAPIATALDHINLGYLSPVIKLGAIAGLTTAILGLLLGQNRIFYAMGRDHLLPSWTTRIHPVYGTPHAITWAVGIIVAIIAATCPIQKVGEMISIGTLFAFTLVSIGVLWLRYKRPDMPRVFKAPFFPLLPIAGIGANIYLMIGLPRSTWQYFLIWTLAGLVIYFTYSARKSHRFHTR